MAYRSCEDCKRWIYDPKTGKRYRHRWTAKPLPAPPSHKPGCYSCPKCEGSNEKTPGAGKRKELWTKNWLTLRLYFEHKAGGGEVRDAILRKNFGIIESVFYFANRDQMAMVSMALTSTLGAVRGG